MVPNLVIALGISPPNGILRQWVRFGAYAVRVIANKCCIICGDSRQFLTQNSIFDNENSTPQPSFDNRASVILDARSAHTVSESLTSSTEPVTGHHTNTIVHPIASRPSNSLHVNAKAGQASDPSENTQLPPLSPTRARFQEPAQDSVDAMERGDDSTVVSPVHSAHSDAILIPTVNQPQKTPQSPKRSTTLSFVSSHSSSGLRSVASSGGEGSTNSGRRPHSPKNAGVAVSLRKNAARGTWEAHIVDTNEAGGNTEDEDAWVRERRDSAEMAEMIYRINSFSTADDGDSFKYSNSDDLGGSSVSSLTRGSSVGSNTIHNSRRHFITSMNPGSQNNASNDAGKNKKAPDFFEKKKKGWFS